MGAMHVRETGAGAADPVPARLGLPRRVLPPAARGIWRADFHVLAPDLPRQWSDRCTAGPPLRSRRRPTPARDFIAERDLHDVVLVGWSMGAGVAWSLIARHGLARIAGLVTSTCRRGSSTTRAGGSASATGSTSPAATRPRRPCRRAWPAFTERIAQSLLAEGLPRDGAIADWARSEVASCDPSAMSTMWRSLVGQDFRALLPRIACPALITYGGRSALYGPDVFSWMAGQSRGARLVCFERSGHAPHLTEPGVFNAALGTFRRDLSG